MAGVLSLICPTAKSKYYCKSGWREFSDLPDGQMSLSQTQEKNSGLVFARSARACGGGLSLFSGDTDN
jgi:hypothetical protein